jgi:hypothetical protein
MHDRLVSRGFWSFHVAVQLVGVAALSACAAASPEPGRQGFQTAPGSSATSSVDASTPAVAPTLDAGDASLSDAAGTRPLVADSALPGFGSNPEFPGPDSVFVAPAPDSSAAEGGAIDGGLDGSAADGAALSDALVDEMPLPCGSIPEHYFHVAGAGSGTFSGCAPKTCAGSSIADIEANRSIELVVVGTSQYAGCTVIDGDLYVNQHPAASLPDLRCLERVTGNMVIWNSPRLTTLAGLESLVEVDGDLELGLHATLHIANQGLVEQNALSALRAVGGSLKMTGGSALTNVGTFTALAAIRRELFVSFEQSTLEFSGMNALQTIGGALSFWRPEGMKAVTHAFQSLQGIGGMFLIWGATELTSLSGFPSLTCVGSHVLIGSRNPDLGDGYSIDNPRLRAVAPFPSLKQIAGDVVIERQNALVQFDMLSTVKSIGGSLYVSDNARLSDLALDGLQTVDGSFIVARNPALSSCPVRIVEQRLRVAGPLLGTVDVTGNLACN